MADKNEVLDYLRNQQKAAEIEAKINGVNMWVLLGAMAVVGWQLTSSSNGKLWSDYELVLRTLVLSAALSMLSFFVRISNSERDELRYSRTNFVEVPSPFVLLFKGILILLPPAGLFVLGVKSNGAGVVGIFGLIFVLLSIGAILKPLFPQSKERFPKPEFGPTRRGELILTLIFGTVLLLVIVEQLFRIAAEGNVSLEDARQMGLMAVLYLLVQIALSRKLQNDSIGWTYEMETDLVLGAISSEVAVRRIENRRLGPRLQDVVDRFFDDLDQRFIVLGTTLKDSDEKLRDAKQVPEQYPAERAARVKEASDRAAAQIEQLAADCKEFRSYLDKLEQTFSGFKRADLAPVLASLKARYESYDDRVRAAKSELRRLLS